MAFTRTTRLFRRYALPLLRWCVGLAVCAGIAALYLSGSLAFIERPLAGARFKLVTSEPSGEVVVVAIDARSLREMSIWPWPRSWHAAMIDQLRSAGAHQIAVDIDFSAASSPAEDEALAGALARAGDMVILPVFEQHADAKNNVAATAPLPL